MLRWLAIAAAILSTASGAVAQIGFDPQRRPKIALVIGNSDYNQDNRYTERGAAPSDRLYDLRNACSDSELIVAELIKLGWQTGNIFSKCNATAEEMLGLVRDFAARYTSSIQPFGFVYFSGHGVQIDQDAYIFGVNARIDIKETLFRYQYKRASNLFPGGLRLREELISQIGDAGGGSVFLVVDACRENPLEAALRRNNIAAVSAPRKGGEPILGLKILYSTANGQLAADGAGGSSPFADVFASQMSKHKSVDHLIRSVAAKVGEQTKFSSIKQVPDEAGTFNEPPPEVCFRGCDDD